MASTSKFIVKTYIFPGQHIRHYPGATRHSEQDILYLEAKQYIPVDNTAPQDGDVTIIGNHGASFPKELYEPLWEHLLDGSRKHGFRIRSIWIADASNSGASGVINEHTQGDQPGFYDIAHDILLMINTFRDQMPQPLVGVGHSMGATSLIHLSLIHPRLLSCLILFDPVVGPTIAPASALLLYASATKRDLWDSREQAGKQIKSMPGIKQWDPRVLQLFMEFGLRDTPTLLHTEPGKVTLRTSKAQEAWTYTRSWFDPLPSDGRYANSRSRIKMPDMNDTVRDTHPFFRTADEYIWSLLPRLRPSVLYVVPEGALLTKDIPIKTKVERTGSGPGGSGSVEEGRVSSRVLKNVGHLLPFEKPADCAQVAAEWLGKDIEGWRQRVEYEKNNRDDTSFNQVALSEEWIRRSIEYAKRYRRDGSVKPKL
jgi:pimeloyl-ACP methyl ester carboxylesterase